MGHGQLLLCLLSWCPPSCSFYWRHSGLLGVLQSSCVLSYPRTPALAIPSLLALSLTSGLCLNVTYLFFEPFLTTPYKIAPSWHPRNIQFLFPALFFSIPSKDCIFFLFFIVTISCFQNVSSRRAGIFPTLFSVVSQHLGQCLAHGRSLIESVVESSCLLETSDLGHALWMSLICPQIPLE